MSRGERGGGLLGIFLVGFLGWYFESFPFFNKDIIHESQCKF